MEKFPEWANRLKEIRIKHGLQQGELARKIDKDSSAISRYEAGRVKQMSKSLYRDLLNVFPASDVEYIKTGYKGSHKKKDLKPIDELVVKSDMVSIPIVTESASAGGGSNVESVDVFDTHEVLVVDRSLFKTPPSGKLHAIKVNGYSMVPMLLPDSWVIFEESETWSGDGLYVLIFRNVLMVKLVEADPKSGSLWIKSANPDYDSWEYDPTQDQSTMKLVGKVLRCVV